MDFETVIVSLMENMQDAWNNSDYETMASLMEEDVTVIIEPVIVNGISIKPQKFQGKEKAVRTAKKIQKKLPLRYKVEYDRENLGKKISYKKFYYELNVWAYFESTISEYGKFKEFRVTKYENTESKKMTAFYVLRNIAKHRLKSIFTKS